MRLLSSFNSYAYICLEAGLATYQQSTGVISLCAPALLRPVVGFGYRGGLRKGEEAAGKGRGSPSSTASPTRIRIV